MSAAGKLQQMKLNPAVGPMDQQTYGISTMTRDDSFLPPTVRIAILNEGSRLDSNALFLKPFFYTSGGHSFSQTRGP